MAAPRHAERTAGHGYPGLATRPRYAGAAARHGGGPRGAASEATHRTVALGAQTLPYRLRRSSRRTIGFAIDAGGLAVTAPRWVALPRIEAAIAGKAPWIFKKLDERRQAALHQPPPPVWGDGARFRYLGEPVTLALDPQAQTCAPCYDALTRRLTLSAFEASPAAIERAVHRWLADQAARVFKERLDLHAPRLGVAYRHLGLSAARTRWGSCSSNGRIRVHWRLIHYPLALIDYVAIHELAHLREMNHSPRFWAIVAAACPTFQENRRALRQYLPDSTGPA